MYLANRYNPANDNGDEPPIKMSFAPFNSHPNMNSNEKKAIRITLNCNLLLRSTKAFKMAAER